MLLCLIQLADDACLHTLDIVMQLCDLQLMRGHLLPQSFHTSLDKVKGMSHWLETGKQRWLAIDDIGQIHPQRLQFRLLPRGVGPSLRRQEQFIQRVHIAYPCIIGCCILRHFGSEEISPLIFPHGIARTPSPCGVKRFRHLLDLYCFEIGVEVGRGAVFLRDLVLDGAVLVGGWGDFSGPGEHSFILHKIIIRDNKGGKDRKERRVCLI